MKVRFSDFLRNTNGKFSGSGLIGVLAGLASILVFISGAVAAYLQVPEAIDIMDKALMGLTVSSVLLGVRKFSKEQDFKKDV